MVYLWMHITLEAYWNKCSLKFTCWLQAKELCYFSINVVVNLLTKHNLLLNIKTNLGTNMNAKF